jgi:hypothetical protein
VLLSPYPAGAKCFFLPAGEAPCSGSFHHQKNSYLRDIPPQNKEKKKRADSAKRQKTKNLEIHETKIIKPSQTVPPNSEFKGYQDYTVQELIINCHNVRYRMEVWKTPTGETLRGELEPKVRSSGHFGPMLKTYILYQDLKGYKNSTTEQQREQKARLETRFDEIFSQSTCFEALEQVLERLKRRKAELLKVLEKPSLPLHNNASEQDIREFVKKRKISGSTRSEEGRRCRDTFASLKKTCRKLGVSFWNYLRDRVCSKNEIPSLAQLIVQKAGSLCSLAQENLVPIA